MTPNLGQGACQAIEDAVVLGACLKENGRVESALLEYERQRMERTRQFVLRSRWLGVIAQGENAILCWVRDTAMRATPKQIATRQVKSMLGFEILSSSERALFS
jgi:2-polyprenyl-6-methoxyphenol hydroxylase-like FAD-dependent oxidoreductase